MPAEIAARALDQQARSFALDVTPYLLYCTGPAVAGLLTSNVAEYCEFKSLEGLLYMGGGAAAAAADSDGRPIHGHCRASPAAKTTSLPANCCRPWTSAAS